MSAEYFERFARKSYWPGNFWGGTGKNWNKLLQKFRSLQDLVLCLGVHLGGLWGALFDVDELGCIVYNRYHKVSKQYQKP